MEIRLHENGLVGTFRTPEGSGPFPAVLALGGSDGGTPEYFLNLCVAEGFACLALAYWGTAGTQMTMVEIPLERIERGLEFVSDSCVGHCFAAAQVIAGLGSVDLFENLTLSPAFAIGIDEGVEQNAVHPCPTIRSLLEAIPENPRAHGRFLDDVFRFGA